MWAAKKPRCVPAANKRPAAPSFSPSFSPLSPLTVLAERVPSAQKARAAPKLRVSTAALFVTALEKLTLSHSKRFFFFFFFKAAALCISAWGALASLCWTAWNYRAEWMILKSIANKNLKKTQQNPNVRHMSSIWKTQKWPNTLLASSATSKGKKAWRLFLNKKLVHFKLYVSYSDASLWPCKQVLRSLILPFLLSWASVND